MLIKKCVVYSRARSCFYYESLIQCLWFGVNHIRIPSTYYDIVLSFFLLATLFPFHNTLLFFNYMY